MKPIFSLQGRRSGFTIVELLVVVLIVIILATLTFTVTSRMRLASAKTKGINQMRNISVAVFTYSGDNALPDAFYATSPEADFWGAPISGAILSSLKPRETGGEPQRCPMTRVKWMAPSIRPSKDASS